MYRISATWRTKSLPACCVHRSAVSFNLNKPGADRQHLPIFFFESSLLRINQRHHSPRTSFLCVVFFFFFFFAKVLY